MNKNKFANLDAECNTNLGTVSQINDITLNKFCQASQKQAIAQLKALGYKNPSEINLRYIDPCTKKAFNVKGLNFDKAAQNQQKGYDIYFVVNPGGNKDEEITEYRAIFYEHDNLEKTKQISLWQDLNLPKPTFQVDTGGKSIHSYWVFDNFISVVDGKGLQSDLLEYADADRSLKNPSRVMRLAGSKYMKGENPGTSEAKIITFSGIKYAYEHLRSHIPIQKVQESPRTNKPIESSLIGIAIPLQQCLTKDDRQLIEQGATEGNRNTCGIKLAINLVGTANRLKDLGIEFEGLPEDLFYDYCDRCNPPLNNKEANSIWKNADKGNRTASLSDEAILNCVKAWQKKQTIFKTNSMSTKKADSLTSSSEASAKKLRLEISRYLATTDGFLKEVVKHEIMTIFPRLSNAAFEKLCNEQKFDESRNGSLQSFMRMKDFLEQDETPLNFLVDGYCLQKSSGILSGLPGAGKTLAAMQLAYAVAIGDSFLNEKCKQAPILFISMDQPSNITRRYMLDMGFANIDNFFVVSETQATSGWTIKDLELLEQWLDEIKPGLVIIDSIRTTICYPLGIEEKSEMVGRYMKDVERLVCKYGSLLWIHHDNKDKEKHGVSRASGSTAIVGNASFHWRLEKASKDDSDPNRILTMPKTRGFESVSVNLKFNPGLCCFEYLGLLGESEEVAKQKTTLEQKILALLQTKPDIGFEVEEIKNCVACSDSIYSILSRMVTRGKIGRRRSQTNPKSKVYYVTSDTQVPPPACEIQTNLCLISENLIQTESCSSNTHQTSHQTNSEVIKQAGENERVFDEQKLCGESTSNSSNKKEFIEKGGVDENQDNVINNTFDNDGIPEVGQIVKVIAIDYSTCGDRAIVRSVFTNKKLYLECEYITGKRKGEIAIFEIQEVEILKS